MKILIVEDEKNIADPIKKLLEKQGFIVDYAEDGQEGLDLALVNAYDCLILDLNLPKVDGVEVAKRMRAEKVNTPILMLTARAQIYNKLEGFDVGADDYLTKPFDMQELMARVKALIKRASENRNLELVIGGWKFNPEQNLLMLSTAGTTSRIENKKADKSKISDTNITDGGSVVKLSNKESGILEYLLRHKGSSVSAEELLEHVWNEDVDMFTSTVKTHIKTLRQKLGVDREILSTIKGKGYIIY